MEIARKPYTDKTLQDVQRWLNKFGKNPLWYEFIDGVKHIVYCNSTPKTKTCKPCHHKVKCPFAVER